MLAGVSPTTAKRAIRHPEQLAPATLNRVREAIEQLHYEPDLIAGALRRGHNKTIGLMVGDLLEPTFAQLTRSIGRRVRERGYSLLLADNEYSSALELQNLKIFYGHRIQGLIIRSAYAAPSNYDYLKRLQQRGTAIVEIDYIQENTPFSYVMLNNQEATFEGVRYLYELGHRHIAYVGLESMPGRPEERHLGFIKALKHFKLALPRYSTSLQHYRHQEAYELTHRILEHSKPPTAIFAYNGTCTLSAYQAIKEKGLRIPEDISLLGFDNYPWTSLVDPAIDVIEQPIEDLALSAVETTLNLIEGKSTQVIRKRLPGTLIRRGSCAAPKVQYPIDSCTKTL